MNLKVLVGAVASASIVAGVWMFTNARIERLEEAHDAAKAPEVKKPVPYHPPKLTPAKEVPKEGWVSAYVPVYSHVFGNRGAPIWVETTLLLRNTSETHPVTFRRVDYFDSAGKLVRSEAKKPFEVGPLETVAFLVARSDHAGGEGANYLVEWFTPEGGNPPVVEAVGTSGDQVSAFVRRAIVTTKDEPTSADVDEL